MDEYLTAYIGITRVPDPDGGWWLMDDGDKSARHFESWPTDAQVADFAFEDGSSDSEA